MPGKSRHHSSPRRRRSPRGSTFPLLQGMALTLRKFLANVFTPKCAADDRVPGAAARLLRPLPRPAHPEDPRGRLAEVRRLLHVRDGVPGRLHPHRGGRAPEPRVREVPDRLRDRPPPLRHVRLLRRRLPEGRDLDDEGLRDVVLLDGKDAIYGIPELTEKPSDTGAGGPGYGYRPVLRREPGEEGGAVRALGPLAPADDPGAQRRDQPGAASAAEAPGAGARQACRVGAATLPGRHPRPGIPGAFPSLPAYQMMRAPRRSW